MKRGGVRRRSHASKSIHAAGETKQIDAEQDKRKPLSRLFPNAAENQEKRNQEQRQGNHCIDRRPKGKKKTRKRTESQFPPIGLDENGMRSQHAEPLDCSRDDEKDHGEACTGAMRRWRLSATWNDQRRERRADEGKFEKEENNAQKRFRGRPGIAVAPEDRVIGVLRNIARFAVGPAERFATDGGRTIGKDRRRGVRGGVIGAHGRGGGRPDACGRADRAGEGGC